MNAVYNALYQRLSGDATFAALSTGGTHKLVGLQDSALPFTVMQKITSTARYTLTAKVDDDAEYQIKAYAKDLKTAQQIIERVETLLTDYALTITGKTLLYLRKTADTPDMVEETEEGNIFSAGATFRLMVS